jgi:hypothetical protein
MNQLVAVRRDPAPVAALVAAGGERDSLRSLDFFAAKIRNQHTHRAYYRAAAESAEQLAFPVALKIESPDIPHKTEPGSFG